MVMLFDEKYDEDILREKTTIVNISKNSSNRRDLIYMFYVDESNKHARMITRGNTTCVACIGSFSYDSNRFSQRNKNSRKNDYVLRN